MHCLKDTMEYFSQSDKHIHTFGTCCLSISCKYEKSLQAWQIRTLRRNLSPHEFQSMELAILQAFDWCLDSVQYPTLTGLLHMAGATEKRLGKKQFDAVQEALLEAYMDSETIAKRFENPGTWALGCLHAAVSDQEIQDDCKKKLASILEARDEEQQICMQEVERIANKLRTKISAS